MTKIVASLILFCICCKPIFSQPKELVTSFGGSLPPWVIEDGKSGIVINLLNDCLEGSTYKVVPRLLPYARRISEYMSGQVSVVTDINEKTINDRGLKGFYSGDIYAYENFLFSLSDRNLKIEKISELSDYSLLTWQGAIAHIGGEYALMAKNNKNYSETHNQKTQLRMLFKNRIDFIQMDGQIYQFFRQELLKENEIDETIKVDKNPLFGKNPNGFLFRSKEVRDACVSKLDSIRQNDKYKDVLYENVRPKV